MLFGWLDETSRLRMPEGPSGAPDRAVLDELSARVRTHPLVEEANLERSDAELVVRFDPERYPDSVEAATLSTTWYRDDCYRFHYHERHRDGPGWQCRWDRHPNPHAAECHFHPPPDGDAKTVVDDTEAPTRPEDALTRVLANVRDRLDDLWADDIGAGDAGIDDTD